MDPETERRLAALIMEDANRLRSEAERHGVTAYLGKPRIRGRPDPQFLHATVRSIQQSNRIVEVNEMWRRRNVELKNERGSERRSCHRRNDSPGDPSQGNRGSDFEPGHRPISDTENLEDDGWKDDEVEEFLHSRVKRGRGAVGSRMDDTGPYPPSQSFRADGCVEEDSEGCRAGRVVGSSLPIDCEKWERNQGDPNMERADCKELHERRRRDRKGKKEKRERETKRKRKSEKVEKSSKSRR